MKCIIRLQGLAPLVTHNSRLADSLGPNARALKAAGVSGRKKTDEQHALMAAGFDYVHRDYLPGGLQPDSLDDV